MTDTRRPGPVRESTLPLEQEARIPDDRQEAISARSDALHRQYGPVNEPTEPLEPEEHAASLPATGAGPVTRKGTAWLFWIFLVFLLSWSGYLLVESLMNVWLSGPKWLSVLLTSVSGLFAVTFGVMLYRQLRSIRRVSNLATLQQRIRLAEQNNDLQEYEKITRQVLKNLGKTSPAVVNEYEIAARNRNTVASLLSLFDNLVLSKIDRDIETVIRNEAMKTAMAIAISPHPALDAFIAFWRGQQMTRTIAAAYGIELSGLSALLVLREIMINVIISGAAEAGGDMLIDTMGNSAVARLFKPLGEGTVIAWRSYRLGRRTQQLCRLTSKV